MKSIFYCLFLLSLSVEASMNCTYTENNEEKSLDLEFFDVHNLAKMRFSAGELDRYFIRSGKKSGINLEEIATKESTYIPPVIKNNKKSTLHVETLKGGNIYTWLCNEKKITLKCQEKAMMNKPIYPSNN